MAGDVVDRELEILLKDHFGGCSYNAGSVVFWKQGKVVVEINFSKAGRLLSIIGTPALTIEEVISIRSLIVRDLLSTDIYVWGGAKIFANNEIDGFFRYRDLFQLVPVPNHAPRPDFLASPHLGIIEVRETGSLNAMVRSVRCSATTKRIKLILFWLVPGVQNFEYHNGPPVWVYGDIVDDQITSELRQEGYAFPNDVRVDGDYTNVDQLTPLQTLPLSEFYQRVTGVYHDKGLVLPSNLAEIIDAVFGLDAEKFQKLLRACFWLQASRSIHRKAKSASYVALVSAVEAFLDDLSRSDCPCCGKPQGPGPTAQFRDFIEQYLPGVPQAERSAFYDLRSKLTHGSAVLVDDFEIWLGTRRSIDEGSKFMRLNQIVRMTILNWLETQCHQVLC